MRNVVSVIIWVACLLGLIVLSVSPLVEPSTVPRDANTAEFSALRAAQHIEAIATAPHPAGSTANTTVQEYIVGYLESLGLSVSVEHAKVDQQFGGQRLQDINIQNVVAIRRGYRSSQSVMLVAHYDSAPLSPGASDDGSGVASLLETARALSSQSQPRNDIVFLFTDGEEVGLRGAHAFLKSSSIAGNIGVVLNFDCRGSSGPVVMYELAGPANQLVKSLSKVVPFPIATSLSADVYRRMPNHTDFTVFKEAGYSGMNFAFFAQHDHYHNATDSVKNVDLRSLQHEGYYSLALAKYYGNVLLPLPVGSATETYFNVGRWTLVSYPTRWCLPLAILASLLLLAAILTGLGCESTTIGGLCLGIVAAVLSISLCAGCAAVICHWKPQAIGATLHSRVPVGVHLAVQGGISFFSFLIAYKWFSRWIRPTETLVAVYVFWSAIAWFLAAKIPGASYLFVLPAIVGLIGLVAYFIQRRATSPATPLDRMMLMAGIAPALILQLPAFGLIQYAIGSTITVVASVMAMSLIAGIVVSTFIRVRL